MTNRTFYHIFYRAKRQLGHLTTTGNHVKTPFRCPVPGKFMSFVLLFGHFVLLLVIQLYRVERRETFTV